MCQGPLNATENLLKSALQVSKPFPNSFKLSEASRIILKVSGTFK